jgi:DUF1365 family protein
MTSYNVTQPVTNKHNYLIPWRIVLEDLIITKIAKKFHIFYGTLRSITVFIRAHHWF